MTQAKQQFLECAERERKPAKDDEGSLVIINPYGGRKQGTRIYKQLLLPMAKSHQWKLNRVIETKSGEHAKLLFDPKSKESLSDEIFNYSSLLIVGGDGFLNHVINGLITLYRSQRQNQEESKEQKNSCLWGDLPIALVPAGSSNGTSFSLGHRSAVGAVSQFLRGQPRPMDLMQVILDYSLEDTPNFTLASEISNDIPSLPHEHPASRKVYYAGLIVSWAIISDHDYFQEHLFRSFDPMYKNLLAPLAVILSKKIYRGKLWIQPVEEPSLDSLLRLGYTDYTTAVTRTGLKSPKVENRLHKVAHWTQSSQKGWYETTDDFILVSILNLPYAGIDQKIAPHAQTSDGSFDLVIVRAKDMTTFELLKIFAIIDTGKQAVHPMVEFYKLKNFILEPLAGQEQVKDGECGHKFTRGMVDVDGELYPKPKRMYVKSIEGGASFIF
jgi:diacylglycerol kinase family enzyme